MIPYFQQIWQDQNIIISTQAGLEEIVKQEIQDMGLPVLKVKNRTVFTTGSVQDLLRLNMNLRCALSVSIPIRTFSAGSYDMLYFRTRKIHWHKLFDLDSTLRIDVRGNSRSLSNSQYVVHRVKDAIMDTFRKFHNGQRPTIDKYNPTIHIIVYLKGNQVTLLLDSSGKPLFKRGYREEHGEAPLKEDLAAALLYFAQWNGQSPILDPFCGTGTILIEAYMKACNIPPNLFRDFAIYHWKGFDSHIVQKIRSDFLSQIHSYKGKPLIGIEKDTKTFSIAQKILKKLNIRSEIRLIRAPFQNVRENFQHYWIITNPPYGKRLEKNEQLEKLFAEFSSFIRSGGPYQKIGILHPSLETLEGFRTHIKKAIDLYNGPIATKFYLVDI